MAPLVGAVPSSGGFTTLTEISKFVYGSVGIRGVVFTFVLISYLF
jgi:hypothetical protein